MRVILLCAGFATRLYPLTLDRAKPLLEVGGRPVLSWILDRILEGTSPSRTVLVSNRRFAADFRAWAALAKVPIEVLDDGSTTNDNRLGAVGDLLLAVEQLGPSTEEILVVAGDNLLEFPLGPLLENYDPREGTRLFVRRLPEPVPPRTYSEVCLEGERVVSFREKPEEVQSPFSALCLYLFPPEIRADLARFRADCPDMDAPGHFLAWLFERQPMRARLVRGRTYDIGSLASLEEARAAFDGREDRS